MTCQCSRASKHTCRQRRHPNVACQKSDTLKKILLYYRSISQKCLLFQFYFLLIRDTFNNNTIGTFYISDLHRGSNVPVYVLKIFFCYFNFLVVGCWFAGVSLP